MIREKTHPCASVQSVFFDKSSPHGFCENLRSVGEIFPCRMPHSTSPHSHISHTTFHTQHITFHILNTPPPNLHYFSHRAPPRVQKHHSQRIFATAYHSAAYRLNVTVRRSPLGLPHHETPSFASRSLSYRNSKHAQRRVLRSASSVQTDLFRPIRPATPAISPKNPTQVFHQKSLEC